MIPTSPMGTSSPAALAALLHAVHGGDREALAELFPLVYEELTLLAHRQRRAWHGDLTLNTTAVVHEVYLKLVHQRQLPAESRGHFLAVAATAMRHILCNYARDRRTRKRGGGAMHVTLDPGHQVAPGLELSESQTDELTALDDALHRFERIAERQARIVECRFFGGMSVEETAEALGISPRTVKRDWNFARAWLRRDIQATLGRA
jgi:RNA polymerase sigma factor (TIGR02999 family)